MSFVFNTPQLNKAGAWLDYRGTFSGGMGGWRFSVDPKVYKRIIIHHSDTNQIGNAFEEAKYIHHIHHNLNGWAGIGYHFIISSEVVKYKGLDYAKVAYVGDLTTQRAHAPNSKGIDKIPRGFGNRFLIGIVFVGNFTNSNPSDAQLRSAHELVKELVNGENGRIPNLTKMTDIRPHKSYDYTSCPGNYDKFKLFIINGVGASEDEMKQIKELETQLLAAEKQLENQISDNISIKKHVSELETIQRDLEATAKRQGEELAALQKLVDNLKEGAEIEPPKNNIAKLFYILFKSANK